MSLNESFDNFFTACRQILTSYREKNIKIINRDIISDYFGKYEKVVAKTLAREHSKFFLAAFERNRTDILADKSDKWLRTGNVYIQFNEGAEEVNPKFKINLSNIYSRAVELRNKAETDFKSMNITGKDISMIFPEVAYADLLIYRFLTLIYDFIQYNVDIAKEEVKVLGKPSDESFSKYIPDAKDLKVIITKMENHMSDNKVGGMIKLPQSVLTNSRAAQNNNPLANLDFGTLFKTMASGLGDKSGGNNIGNLVSKFAENSKVKDLMNNIGESLSGNKEPGEVIASIASTVMSKAPAVLEEVQKEMATMPSPIPPPEDNLVIVEDKGTQTEDISEVITESISESISESIIEHPLETTEEQ